MTYDDTNFLKLKIGKGSARVYPHEPNTKMRSTSEIIKYSDEAVTAKKVVVVINLILCSSCHYALQIVFGVKGKSVLHILPHFDLVKGTCSSRLHALCPSRASQKATQFVV